MLRASIIPLCNMHCELCIISYFCHIMIEKEPTPYPERTENVIVLVCEPATEYETPNNLQIAQKFVMNGYDVFLLSNPKATKSADFIIQKRNCLYYVEGKTSTGGSALAMRLSDGAKQADRIAINFIGNPQINILSAEITNVFIQNVGLHSIYLFKKSRLIVVTRDMALSKKFSDVFYNLWRCKK